MGFSNQHLLQPFTTRQVYSLLAVNKNKPFELYLCEKPSQGRDIAKALGISQRNDGYLQGNGILVSWCIGHLLEMVPPDAYDDRYKRWSLQDLPILPQQWKLTAKKSTRKQLTVIKKLLKQAHSVVIATDADREGETIAREVLEHLKFRGATRRLWLSALDPISIQRALNSIRNSQETLPLYHSGLARGRADWLIGMNLTRAYTILGSDRQVRSVGRVQTPTLALIVNRDREISNFNAVPYYEIEALFQTKSKVESQTKSQTKGQNHQEKPTDNIQLLETKWLFPAAKKNQDEAAKHCLDKQLAQGVIERCQNQYGIVSTASTQRKKLPPPLLYNLSGLQQEASRRWTYGAQEVLNIAQALYETHKLTTYPRSDCEYLPLSQFNDVSQVFQSLCKNDPTICHLLSQANQQQRSRVWNDKKITAHHAIIPTQAAVTGGINKLNNKERNVYDLIRRRYIAQFFPDYEYDQSIILITIQSDQFKASGRIPRMQGWKQAIGTGLSSNKKSAANEKELPAVEKGEQLLCDRLDLKNKLTQPPKHFTEGTLIKAMETIGSQVIDKVMKKILRETAGLGTQATRANIIQTLFQRKYIMKDKKFIKASTLGFALCDAVPETIKDPLLTAQWEQQLDDIANNKGQDISGFLQQQISLLKAIISRIKQPAAKTSRQQELTQYKAGDPCPDCGHPLEIRQAIRGKKIGQNYIGCSRFPECRFYSWS
ncbi:MAG: DNA topoisomerase III [gamma proteobacterium symbiont of Lucinoma myriamae]|nr:DNA topoisomerase III [gamma proteobacterium symbiont of Lucinoma myriamae]MCU7818088.1 DNA topoisomerase III [gamma proteobacterium symbiont of Lucinoma myriamae]MCU7832277.1 DNA topoisomerase III [gamma proteobacterium symbiont of Lucinoma myriamae]